MPEVRDVDSSLAEHAAFLRSIARRLIGDPSSADDLVQEAMVRALGRPPVAMRSMRGWLATIVRNVFRDQRAADRARQRREQDVARQRGDAHFDADPFGIELLSAALRALPADYRRVIELRHYAQRPVGEIARELGVPEATVKTRLHRGLGLLRADLEQRAGGRRGLRRALGPLVLSVPFPVATTAAGGSAFLWGFLMKKWLFGAAALLLAAYVGVVAPPWQGDDAAPASAAISVDATGAHLVAPTAVGAAAPTTTVDPPAAPVDREPVGTGAAPVQGRVVHAETRQGVPFLAVSVRDARGREDLVTDRDGAFRTARAFDAAAEVHCDGLRVQARADDDRKPFDGNHAGLPEGAVVLRPVDGSPPLFRLPTTERTAAVDAAERWRRVADLGGATAALVDVDLGPTYFVTLVPPAGLATSDLATALGRVDDEDVAWLRDWSRTQAPLHDDPTAPGRFWCRPGATQRVSAANGALFVFSKDGLWRGRASVHEIVGVQEEPVAIALTSAGVVTGVVRDPTGAPIRDQWVTFVRTTEARIEQTSSRTDADGRYRITHVVPGPGRLDMTGEAIVPWRKTLDVAPGLVTECDIVVMPRPVGGAIAGTITTDSGEAFPMSSVILTSRDDASIWRTAGIEWRDVDGRQQATWSFENVPGIRCEVTLETFEPCGVVQRRFEVVAPAERVAFHVLDRLPRQRVTFVPSDPGRRASGGFAVHLVGDAGWQMHCERDDLGPLEFELPVGAGFAWRAIGAGIRAGAGHAVVPAAPFEVAVPIAPGFSAVITCMDIANFFAARDVELFADGASIGRSDADGVVRVDLPKRPNTMALDPTVWRIFHDAAHRSDVDAATGAFRIRDASGRLHLYVQRVF